MVCNITPSSLDIEISLLNAINVYPIAACKIDGISVCVFKTNEDATKAFSNAYKHYKESRFWFGLVEFMTFLADFEAEHNIKIDVKWI